MTKWLRRHIWMNWWHRAEEGGLTPAPKPPWEWMQVRSHAGHEESGWVPRWYAERLGVNCTPLDRRDDFGRQGTAWIRSDQAEKLRASQFWRTPAEFAVLEDA